MDRHDYGVWRVFEFLQQVVQFWSGPPARRGLLEFFDIRSGDKGPAAADDHNGVDGGIILRCVYTRGKSLRYSRTQRIYGRILHRNNGNIVLFIEGDKFVHETDSFTMGSAHAPRVPSAICCNQDLSTRARSPRSPYRSEAFR